MKRDGMTFAGIQRSLRESFCSHQFRLDDLQLTRIPVPPPPPTDASIKEHFEYLESLPGHLSHTERVSWRCAKCNREFRAHCGLDVSPRHGPLVREISK